MTFQNIWNVKLNNNNKNVAQFFIIRYDNTNMTYEYIQMMPKPPSPTLSLPYFFPISKGNLIRNALSARFRHAPKHHIYEFSKVQCIV